MRIVALALLLAACSRVPDYSDCSLVGTWSHWIPNVANGGMSPERILADKVRAVTENGYDGTESFLADGRWIFRTSKDDVLRSRWTLMACDDGLISVRCEAPGARDGQLIRTFAPESKDLFLERRADGLSSSRLVRVPDPK